MKRRRILSLSALSLATLLVCCAGNGSSNLQSVEINGEKVLVVDMHLHTGRWKDLPMTQQAFLSGQFPPPLNAFPGQAVDFILSSAGIRNQLNDAQIQAGVLFAVYAPNTVGTTTNELVRDRVADAPTRFLGMGSADITNWSQDSAIQLAKLERDITDYKLIGIKLAHPHMQIALDDPQYFGIYKIAEKLDVPVYVHCGNTPTPNARSDDKATDPAFLEDAIRLHPKARIILGHVGYDFIKHDLGKLDTCIRLAKTYPNVYLEASALGSAGSDPTGQNLPAVYQRFKAEGLVDRVIYGSDGPQRPGFVKDYLNRTINAMKNEGYSIAEMKKVLSGNFIDCFASSLLRVGLNLKAP